MAVASVALMTLDHRQHLADPLRQGLAAVVYPVQYTVDLPFRATHYLGEQLRSRQALIEENQRLRSARLDNRARLLRLAALEQENERLRELLGSSGETGHDVAVTELMRVDMDPHTHLIQIDRGSAAGAFIGQPLLDADGVMGQIDRLGPYAATVRLISDPSHAIPVEVNRTGFRAVALGTGEVDRLELANVPNNADLQEGDLLVSSGLGGVFPRGYPVAEVTRVEIDPGEPFARVSARPTAALDRSRQFLLVRGGETESPETAAADPDEESREER